jgi:hypothetical protein
MYERAFDLDWETISAEEALRRMYALGISAELGHEYDDERTRILRIADTAYQRSVLDLAYNEGRNALRDHREEFDSDDAAWEHLVEAKGIDLDPSAEEIDTDDTPSELPTAVERASMLELDVDDLERLKLPKFLRRDD